MKTIAEVAGLELTWSPSGALKARHELTAGGDVVATINFDRATLATATVEGAAWTFKREGFWRTKVTVREQGSDDDVAVFRPHALGGGDLRIGAQEFELSTGVLSRKEWSWSSRDEVLVRFGDGGQVQVTDSQEQRAEVPMLVVLGWYLVLLGQKDAVQAGVAAATASRVVVMR